MKSNSNDKRQSEDCDDVASAVFDQSLQNKDQSSAVGTGQTRSDNLLRSEAVADFKALNGYWARIIVKGMASSTDDSLPDLLIA